MHNAGFYCIYPEDLTSIVEEIRFLDLAVFCDEVFNDEKHVSACRKTSAEVTSLFRGMAGQYSLQQHQQELLSLVWRETGVDELRIKTIREALIVWVHVLGRWGNSHFSGKDINSKRCHRLTNLAEEEMTLEWAGICSEQGLLQYIIRIAEVSGASRLIPLFSGNAGWMVAENLHRFDLQGTVEMVDSLLRDPIKNEWEFVNKINALPAPMIVTDGLQPPAVVHLFGHLKNHHLMLRRVIFFIAADMSHLSVFRDVVRQSLVDICTSARASVHIHKTYTQSVHQDRKDCRETHSNCIYCCKQRLRGR